MLVVSKGVKLVPGKLQSVGEVALEFIRGMTDEFIGEEGKNIFILLLHYSSLYSRATSLDWFPVPIPLQVNWSSLVHFLF